MIHGLGCIPDRDDDVLDDLRDRHVGVLLGSTPTALPTHLDYSALVDGIPNQGKTESCVGWAFASALLLRSRIAGTPIARPSAKAIWDCARLIDRPRMLFNMGCRPRAALVGMMKYGLVAESRWPLTESSANTPPPLDVFRAGIGATLAAYYRIADDVATLVREALVQGFIPFFGMPVDDAFDHYEGGAPYDGLKGPMKGRHAMVIVGYGPGYVRILNSWGDGWGDGGFGLITDRALNELAFDVLVPTIIPSAVR